MWKVKSRENKKTTREYIYDFRVRKGIDLKNTNNRIVYEKYIVSSKTDEFDYVKISNLCTIKNTKVSVKNKWWVENIYNI